MKLNRLSAGDLLAAAAAVLLAVSLFLTWYDPSEAAVAVFPVSAADAWSAFGLIDLCLAAVALFTVVCVVLKAAPAKLRQPLSPWFTLFGLVAVALIAYRLIDPPSLDALESGVSIDVGAWLGLAGAIGVSVGGHLAMGSEGTSFAKAASAYAEPPPPRRRRRRPPPAPRRRPGLPPPPPPPKQSRTPAMPKRAPAMPKRAPASELAPESRRAPAPERGDAGR